MLRIPTAAMDRSPRGDMEGTLPGVVIHGEPCKRKDVYAIACAMTVEVKKSRALQISDGGDTLRVPQKFNHVHSGPAHKAVQSYVRVMGRIMQTACSCGSLTGHDVEWDVCRCRDASQESCCYCGPK